MSYISHAPIPAASTLFLIAEGGHAQVMAFPPMIGSGQVLRLVNGASAVEVRLTGGDVARLAAHLADTAAPQISRALRDDEIAPG